MNQRKKTNNDFYALFADGELIVTKELGFLHTLAFAENAAELLRAVNPNKFILIQRAIIAGDTVTGYENVM